MWNLRRIFIEDNINNLTFLWHFVTYLCSYNMPGKIKCTFIKVKLKLQLVLLNDSVMLSWVFSITLTCSQKWDSVGALLIPKAASSSFCFCCRFIKISWVQSCLVPHAHRDCLQAPRVPRAWLLWGTQVHHPVKWPCCHCWIYHQAAVLSSWISKGQTDICMVNLISFLCTWIWFASIVKTTNLQLQWLSLWSYLGISISHFNYIWVFSYWALRCINVTAKKICRRMRAGPTLECLNEVLACLGLFLEGCCTS